MGPPVNVTAPINAHCTIFNIKTLPKMHTLYTCLFPLILHRDDKFKKIPLSHEKSNKEKNIPYSIVKRYTTELTDVMTD
jgi:hypothetical protein